MQTTTEQMVQEKIHREELKAKDEQIAKLQEALQGAYIEIAFYRGRCSGEEEFWRIWNGVKTGEEE